MSKSTCTSTLFYRESAAMSLISTKDCKPRKKSLREITSECTVEIVILVPKFFWVCYNVDLIF